MIFVVVEEVIPESHRRGNTDLATLPTIWLYYNDDFGYSVRLARADLKLIN